MKWRWKRRSSLLHTFSLYKYEYDYYHYFLHLIFGWYDQKIIFHFLINPIFLALLDRHINNTIIMIMQWWKRCSSTSTLLLPLLLLAASAFVVDAVADLQSSSSCKPNNNSFPLIILILRMAIFITFNIKQGTTMIWLAYVLLWLYNRKHEKLFTPQILYFIPY